MRPLTPNVRRLLALAGLWSDSPCIPCGARGIMTAEHALYATPDGRQGMGARQLGDYWAIIPACPTCNVSGAKGKNAWVALRVGERFGLLTAPQKDYLAVLERRYSDADYDAVSRRIDAWTDALKEAKKL